MKILPFLATILSLSLTCLFTAELKAQKNKDKSITHIEAIKKMSNFGKAEYKDGQRLYKQVCYTCHGDLNQPPSVPNARLFYRDKLLSGPDPYSLFQTLTKGYNMMPPQPWMTDDQKYRMIYYLRETFFKKHNPDMYVALDDNYLATLKGKKDKVKWPAKIRIGKVVDTPFEDVDYGPALFGHFEASVTNFAPKGLIIGVAPENRNVSGAKYQVLYDLDTGRLAAATEGRTLDWNDLNYNGQHRVHAKIPGMKHHEFPKGLGWAKPGKPAISRYPDFRDPREEGLDGYKYGPLPKEHLKYRGLYMPTSQNGLKNPAIHYSVGDAEVLDTPSLILLHGQPVWVRSLLVKPHKDTLHVRTHIKKGPFLLISKGGAGYIEGGGRINDGVLRIDPSDSEKTFHVLIAKEQNIFKGLNRKLLPSLKWPAGTSKATNYVSRKAAADVKTLETEYKTGAATGPFQVDEIVLPQIRENPWNTKLRLSGIDFLTDDRAVVSSWTGDVFLIDGMLGTGKVTITRIASGLHQPMGVRVRDGEIFVGCRDQILRLHDQDGDCVADYYEAFNSDHILSMHFHEFAAGLDMDSEGRFYYVKSAQHASPAFYPQHGRLIRVSKDGLKSEMLASGLRSVNGTFVDKDGTVWLTDQEGFWNPQNKIMKVEMGGFHGNMLAWYDPSKITESDNDMVHPLVWLPKNYANSPSEVFRFPSKGWGNLNGVLGYLEYGRSQIMLLPHEELSPSDIPEQRGKNTQGMAHPLPIDTLKTGIMRARFHPKDQSMYACGLFGWGSSYRAWGGLFRIRPTGEPAHCFTGYAAKEGRLVLTMTDELKGSRELSPEDITLTSFHINRTKNYGAKLVDKKTLKVSSVKVNGQTITLHIPELKETRILDIQMTLPTNRGEVKRHMSATIHRLK